MNNYFHRQIQLWGEDTQNTLKTKKIAIIGSGGLGCSVAISLGSSGIGTIYCIDFDKIEIHNIHRQLAFTPNDEGRYKSEVLTHLLNLRSPYIKAIPITKNFSSFTKDELKLDLIIDATDNLMVRAQIDKYAKEQNIPWIYGSVEEFNGQVCFLDKSDFNAFKIKDREPKGITAPMVMHIASHQANLALRYLTDLPIKKDLLHYIYFDSDGELTIQKFKMPKVDS
jgi:molybdopterin/thiamine biosynthesis adenylyltransferase